MGWVHLAIDEEKELSRLFEEEVAETVEQAKLEGRLSRIALSGGSVAARFLPGLRGSHIQESNIEVFFCDERAVPLDHEESNFRAARELWLDAGRVPRAQIHPLFTQPSMKEAARRYEEKLRQVSSPLLDLALLGVGPDGHIASLFPKSPVLGSERLVEPVYDAPKPPPERLTMTLRALSASRCVIVAAFGAEKAETIKHCLTSSSDLPLCQLLKRRTETRLLLDTKAAALIEETTRRSGKLRL